jgi:uncharacterized protein (TIGR00730 family)
MKIAFFCSARENVRLKYEEKVLELLNALDRDIPFTHVVYGGGGIGLMGTVYNFFKDKKIIESHNLEKWRFEENPDENLYTSILKRQKMLLLNSDVYVILPGGVGTLSEFFDAIVLNEIEHQNKPIIVFNCDGYYDRLIDLITDIINNKVSATDHKFLCFSSDIKDIVTTLSYPFSQKAS